MKKIASIPILIMILCCLSACGTKCALCEEKSGTEDWGSYKVCPSCYDYLYNELYGNKNNSNQSKYSSPSENTSNATMGEENALGQAWSYLDYSAFSYSGLIEQLEYEGYTHSEAKYGADNCGADWYEQAALMAKDYLDYSSFSREGLIEQLEYEGFTHDQAVYGVEQNGY